jgi:Flp pilus assembly protein TadD
MTRFTLKHLVICAALATASATPGFAADTETTPARNVQVDDFKAGKAAVDAKNWQQAIDSFSKVVAKDPKNADAYNYLGFSNRWLDRYDQAFDAYGKALALEPNHKGALNYSGIAYIKSGQKDKAQAQLARLQQVCANCEETANLSKALAEAK